MEVEPAAFLPLVGQKENNNPVVGKTLQGIFLFLCPEEKRGGSNKEVAACLDGVVRRVGGAILVGRLEKPWLSKFSSICFRSPVFPPSPQDIEEAMEREGLVNVILRMRDFELLDHVLNVLSLPFAETARLGQWQIIHELMMRGTEMILCSIPFQLCQELWFALHEPKKANPANVSNEGCVNQQQDLVQKLMVALFSLPSET